MTAFAKRSLGTATRIVGDLKIFSRPQDSPRSGHEVRFGQVFVNLIVNAAQPRRGA